MTDEDRARQQALHQAVVDALDDELDGKVLAGWVIVYEAVDLSGDASAAGHFYGPGEMTTWRALGLLEWARRFGLTPDGYDEIEGDG